MPVNENIYVPAYVYTAGSADYLVDAMTVTETVPNILKNDLYWQADRLLDSSNVYTTFDPKYFPNLFGSTITRIHIDFGEVHPDSKNRIPRTNTSAGVKNITFTPSTDKVNLRYIMYDRGVEFDQMLGYRWTNVDAETLTWQKEQIRDQYPSNGRRDYPNVYEGGVDRTSGGSGVTGYGNGNYAFVTDINREALFYNIRPQFAYIDGVSLRAISIPRDVYTEWLLNDDTGILNYEGHNCFVNYMKNDIYYDQPADNRRRISRADGNSFYYNKYGDSPGGSGGGGSSSAFTVLCERVVGVDTYYYTPPINDNAYTSGNVGPAFTTYTRHGNMQADNSVYPTNHGSSITDSSNPYITFFSHFTIDEDIDGNYYDSFALFGIGTGDKNFPEDSQRPGASQEPDYVWELDGQCLICYGVRNYDTQTSRLFSVHKKLYTGKEIMAMHACMLIPFFIYDDEQNISYSDLQKEDSPVKFYIGIREDDGCVAGRYKEWKFHDNDEIEKELRPDDFTPYEPQPETPDTPSSPPDSDRTKGDTGTVTPAGAYTIGAATGLCTYYVIGGYQVRALGSALWGGIDPAEMMKNFYYYNDNKTDYQMSYSEILDYIASLKYFPFNVHEVAQTQDPHEKGYRIGNGTTLVPDTSLTVGNPEYLLSVTCELDGGSVTIPHEENSFMDYEPCSVASIYVPFCGTANLKLSSVTGKTLYLKYYVDLVSGCCIAIVSMRGRDGEFPVAQLSGVVGFDVMLTGNNQNQQMSSILSSFRQDAMSLGGSIASAGLGAAAGDIGSVIGGFSGAFETVANNVINLPQTASLHPMTAGSNSSLAALCGYTDAFVQATRVISQTPGNFGNTVGFIINSPYRIGELSGFTQAVNPSLDNISATEQEKQMLESILTNGFYA